MDFPFASAPDIIRARQKDTSYELKFQSDIKQLAQYIKGVRFLHAYSSHIDVAASTAYLCLTTLLGTRTLGEEYTDLVYLGEDRTIPSWSRKAAWVFSSNLGPMLVGRLIARKRLEWLNKLDEDSILYSVLDSCNSTTMISLNLTLFYFAGSYYELSKRLFKLRYAFGHRVNPLEMQGSYEFLGVLMIVKTAGSLFNKLKVHYMQSDGRAPEEQVAVDLENSDLLPYIPLEARDCNLCLEFIKDPTVTLCGHMFCWSCITEWCRDNAECPLCRQKCAEQNLLLLQA